MSDVPELSQRVRFFKKVKCTPRGGHKIQRLHYCTSNLFLQYRPNLAAEMRCHFTQTSQLAGRLLAFGSAFSVALLTRQEQKAKRRSAPAEGRMERGALRSAARKRVIICRAPAARRPELPSRFSFLSSFVRSFVWSMLFRARPARFSHMVIYCS